MNYFNFESVKNKNKKNKEKKQENNFRNFLETTSFLFEKKENIPDLLLIDFDGVLLDISYKEILSGLFYYLFDKNQFKKFVQKNKVGFDVLKELIKLSKKTKVVILTGRFLNKKEESNLKNVFPYISEEFIKKLDNKFNIRLIPQVKKNLVSEEIKDLVSDSKKIVYLGSSVLDEILLTKLKNINKNIIYYHVGNNKIL